MSLLVVGCGIPKEDYDAAVAAKEEAESKVASLQSDLREAESQISALESEVSSQQAQVSSLTSIVATVESALAALRSATKVETVTPTPTVALSKDYSKYGFGFDYTKGFSVTEMGLLGSEANDNSGMVQVSIENDVFEIFQVSWMNMIQSIFQFAGGIEALLDAGFEGLNVAGAESFEKGDLIETTKAGHRMVYQYFTITSFGVTMPGIMGVFYCDESQRVYQLLIMRIAVSGEQDILEHFQEYLDSFVGH